MMFRWPHPTTGSPVTTARPLKQKTLLFFACFFSFFCFSPVRFCLCSTAFAFLRAFLSRYTFCLSSHIKIIFAFCHPPRYTVRRSKKERSLTGKKGTTNMRHSSEMDMCSGPLVGNLLRFSIPLMASSILQLH